MYSERKMETGRKLLSLDDFRFERNNNGDIIRIAIDYVVLDYSNESRYTDMRVVRLKMIRRDLERLVDMMHDYRDGLNEDARRLSRTYSVLQLYGARELPKIADILPQIFFDRLSGLMVTLYSALNYMITLGKFPKHLAAEFDRIQKDRQILEMLKNAIIYGRGKFEVVGSKNDHKDVDKTLEIDSLIEVSKRMVHLLLDIRNTIDQRMALYHTYVKLFGIELPYQK